MLKKILVLVALAVSLAGFATSASAETSVCATVDITVNGTAAPVNGTTCVP